jgi:hypothetical protein
MASVEDVCETCLEQAVRDYVLCYARRCGDAPIEKLTRTVSVSINLGPLWMRSGYFFKWWEATGLGSERAGVKSAFVGTEFLELLYLMKWTEMCHLLVFLTPFFLLYTHF